MFKNPFPKTIMDESSGVEVPNDRYCDWQSGYTAGFADSIIATGKSLNAGMKSIGLRIPVISDILEQLK